MNDDVPAWGSKTSKGGELIGLIGLDNGVAHGGVGNASVGVRGCVGEAGRAANMAA
jgi:hypothetical protein